MCSCLQCALGVGRLGAKSGAMRLPWRRAESAGAVGAGAHSKSTIADVFSKDLGCVAPFLVMVVTYSCFWLCDCHLLYFWYVGGCVGHQAPS